jgi:hypothetical protein
MYSKHPEDIKERTWDGCYLPADIWNFFEYLNNYAERTISESTAAYINNAMPNIHAHPGQKTSRVVNKMCVYLGYDKVDGYNREFAKYADSLSPMIIKRHTVLSINPMDYLTMSFGNSWASCHTIDKENKRRMPNSYSGCYSSGTISYMLDSVSMVLYTVDASYNGNEYWTQPKINRQMFHYGEEKLIQARLYPQDNDGATSVYVPYRNIVQQIIATIFDFPNLWTFSKGTDATSRFVYDQGTHYRDYFHYSNCTLSRIKGSENSEHITIGGIPICVQCGRRHDVADNINCCHNYYICEECGERIYEEDVIWIDGDAYCRDCCSYCDECNEYHRGNSTYVESVHRYVCESCLEYNYTYCECCGEYEHNDLARYIECEDRYVCEACCDRYYFYCDDCGEYFPNKNRHEYEHLTLCESCYEDRKADEEDENEDEENEEVC